MVQFERIEMKSRNYLVALLVVAAAFALLFLQVSCGDDDDDDHSASPDDDDDASGDPSDDDTGTDDDDDDSVDDDDTTDDDVVDDDDTTDDDVVDDDDSTVSAQEGDPAYDLAQGCFAVRADRTDFFLVADEDDHYGFGDVAVDDADRFFLKPTGLGTFMLYDQNQGYLATDGQDVLRYTGAGNDIEWRINELEILDHDQPIEGKYTLVSTEHALRLLAGDSGPSLAPEDDEIDPDTAALEIIPLTSDACAPFPEAPLNAVVSPVFYVPRDPTDPVVGYADLHAHLGFEKSLGAVGMAGHLFHKFGVELALGDCEYLHGEDGAFDFLGVSGGTPGHETAGWPDFTFWPNRCAYSHMMNYYRWIERAYLGGLRLIVTMPTGNASYCQLMSMLRPGLAEGDCSAADTVELQTLVIYDLQDYIDAQEGGPGKGWFRIVTSPAEARQVIAQNKLAVVLGVEYNTLFDCREGQEAKCTAQYIEQELDKLYNMGIRSVYPIHRFDNAFGGTRPGGGTSNAWMNLTNKMNTGDIDHVTDLFLPGQLLFEPSAGGHFWEVGACPVGASGHTNLRNMQEFFVQDVPSFGSVVDNLVQIILIDKLAPIPDYADYGGAIPGCNTRHLQPAGEDLINGLVDRGMIVQIDHLSYYTLVEVLDLLEDRQYSGVISDHGWIENSIDIRNRIYALGGLVVRGGSPSSAANMIEQVSGEMSAYPYATGVGIGTDVQGMCCQPTSSGVDEISYPFTSIDGLVTFEQPTLGNRTFDFVAEGIAHYGLYPEWVESLRQVDEDHPAQIMDTFMYSAETYLQMWERAEASVASKRK